MYTRQLEIYKGIDNTIQFLMLNADQKPVDVTGQSVRFIAHDAHGHLCLDIPANPVSWDDSTVRIGLYSVTITRNDLLALDPQYITYWLKLVDFDGAETLSYVNVAFGNPGTGRIRDQMYPNPRPVAKSKFSAIAYTDEKWYTDPVSLDPGINSNNALHTAAIYSNGYQGQVLVQVSLENNTVDSNGVWSTVGDPIQFTGEETEPVPVNFHGVYNYVRFCALDDPANLIPYILVRT